MLRLMQSTKLGGRVCVCGGRLLPAVGRVGEKGPHLLCCLSWPFMSRQYRINRIETPATAASVELTVCVQQSRPWHQEQVV